MAKKGSASGAAKVKITRDLLAKALTYHCPFYTREGVFSCCNQGGRRTNCGGAAMLCTHVTDIFRTMAKIAKGELEVY
jgi:hypothetical protein